MPVTLQKVTSCSSLKLKGREQGAPLFFDTHCHLDLPELLPQLEAHLKEAKALGVRAFLVPATMSSAWPTLLTLQERYGVEIALGVHPWWASQEELTALADLPNLAGLSSVCAIGEIGLDYALLQESFATQLACFRVQLGLASTLKKPVILHHRKSMPALLQELKAARFTQGGILHAFSGSYEQGKAFIDLGFKLGIGGVITYLRAQKTRSAVQRFSLEDLVLETDAPSMPLQGRQGQVNTPAQLFEIAKVLAELRHVELDVLSDQLWQSSHQALRLAC